MAGFQNAIDQHRPDPFVSSEVETPTGLAQRRRASRLRSMRTEMKGWAKRRVQV
jgi:hypothetical protein